MGQETLMNLLLRNYLHDNLYDQVRHWRRSQPAHVATSLFCVTLSDANRLEPCNTVVHAMN
jgi:hypothetical protein